MMRSVSAPSSGIGHWVSHKVKLWYPPILAYHRILPGGGAESPTLTPEGFRRQVEILATRWRPIPLSTLVSWLEGKTRLPAKAVVLTFDDGTDDTFTYAYPILARYQVPATVFLIVGSIGEPGYLEWEQIHQMRREGFTFGSHGLTHDYLPSLPPEKARRSLAESLQTLRRHKVPAEFASYPAGGFTPEIAAIAREEGYRAACTTNRGLGRFPIDRWALRRVTAHESAGSQAGMWLHCCGYYGLNRRLRPPS